MLYFTLAKNFIIKKLSFYFQIRLVLIFCEVNNTYFVILIIKNVSPKFAS